MKRTTAPNNQNNLYVDQNGFSPGTKLIAEDENNKQEETPMKKFLIVGLGNIGAEYVNTRHNIGFKILDYFAKKEAIPFQTAKLGDIAEFKTKGRTLILLKPNTYMNLSGKAVKYWMEKENIEKENLVSLN